MKNGDKRGNKEAVKGAAHKEAWRCTACCVCWGVFPGGWAGVQLWRVILYRGGTAGTSATSQSPGCVRSADDTEACSRISGACRRERTATSAWSAMMGTYQTDGGGSPAPRADHSAAVFAFITGAPVLVPSQQDRSRRLCFRGFECGISVKLRVSEDVSSVAMRAS